MLRRRRVKKVINAHENCNVLRILCTRVIYSNRAILMISVMRLLRLVGVASSLLLQQACRRWGGPVGGCTAEWHVHGLTTLIMDRLDGASLVCPYDSL